MSRILPDLLIVVLVTHHAHGPTPIEIRDQVITLGMVDAKLSPALDQLVLEYSGLFRLDAADLGLFFEKPSDELARDISLRWNPHFITLLL